MLQPSRWWRRGVPGCQMPQPGLSASRSFSWWWRLVTTRLSQASSVVGETFCFRAQWFNLARLTCFLQLFPRHRLTPHCLPAGSLGRTTDLPIQPIRPGQPVSTPYRNARVIWWIWENRTSPPTGRYPSRSLLAKDSDSWYLGLCSEPRWHWI